MFDGSHYFETVLRAIGTCESYTEVVSPGVIVEDDWQEWKTISWRATITFSTGEVLDAFEFHEKKNFKHYRKAKYQFMDAGKSTIFRVDTHRTSIQYDDPCHIDLGNYDEVLLDGNPLLQGQSLAGIDFLVVFNWIHQHLEGNPFPWERR